MNFRDRGPETKIELVGLWLLIPASVLALALLGINCVIIFSAFHEQSSSPPPPRIVPLPITGWPVWLLWLGPPLMVLLLFGPAIIEHWLTWAKAQGFIEKKIEPRKDTLSPSRVQRHTFVFVLRGVLLGLAILAQFLVLCNAGSFDTSGTAYMTEVVAVSPQQAWATGFFDYNVGGTHSLLWHYNGRQWAEVEGPDVSGLTVLPNGDVWGVGDAGNLEHESGGRWTQVSSGTDELHAIAMRTPTDGWAVGGHEEIFIANTPGSVEATAFQPLAPLLSLPDPSDNCQIVHGLNGIWTPVFCPVREVLNSVAVLPDGEAWAVGKGGTILHKFQDRDRWIKVKSPTQHNLQRVVMLSANNGWAIGDWGTLLHYTQGSWQQLPLKIQEGLRQIAMVNADEGWIVGAGGTVLHYTQGNWQMSKWAGELSLSSISLVPGDSNDGWIVGFDNSPQTRFWQKQGADWRQYQVES